MLIKLRKKTKAQATAEYAMVITAVIAFLATGQVLLKGSLKKKAQQAFNYYSKQGDEILGTTTTAIPMFEQKNFENKTYADKYLNTRVTLKGGAEEKLFKQGSLRTGTTVELKDSSSE